MQPVHIITQQYILRNTGRFEVLVLDDVKTRLVTSLKHTLFEGIFVRILLR